MAYLVFHLYLNNLKPLLYYLVIFYLALEIKSVILCNADDIMNLNVQLILSETYHLSEWINIFSKIKIIILVHVLI